MKLLVTGGAGFIGSTFLRHLLHHTSWSIVNLDALTYAANPAALAEIEADPRYAFEHADIRDRRRLFEIFAEHRPDGVVHLAAESHVDRSIDGPGTFVATNINGTFELLENARTYWSELEGEAKRRFRFHHVSTDEVFGSLEPDDPAFTETTPYMPRSPYAASKAASDHLVRAWHHTYGLPVVLSNASNNYGPGQFPEKLIPLSIIKAARGEPVPVYGSGLNVRDWLHVEDHAAALLAVFEHGAIGESYNVGGRAERTNLEVVRAICSALNEQRPEAPFLPHERLITFVSDRPGHDHRYAMATDKLERELGWRPRHDFASGIKSTVAWYLKHAAWCEAIRRERYDGARLGRTGAQRFVLDHQLG